MSNSDVDLTDAQKRRILGDNTEFLKEVIADIEHILRDTCLRQQEGPRGVRRCEAELAFIKSVIATRETLSVKR
jgi:hypothetical protein